MTGNRIARPCAIVLAGLAACAAGPGALRFHDRPPVTVADDRRPIPRPATRQGSNRLHHLDANVARRGVRILSVPDRTAARDVNSLDLVPDSTWYQDRVDRVTPGDVRRGPGEGQGPVPPIRIVSGKIGRIPGFRVRDAAGVGWIVKFDPRGEPDLTTATEIVAQRLVWAAGWHVPETAGLHLAPGDLVLAPEATFETPDGRKRTMTAADVAATLDRAHRAPDRTLRVVASRLVPGKVLGGTSPEGTRPDDPNDTVPHEDRRTMRGLYVVYAWLDQVDVKPDNTLEAWVPNPDDATRGHVVHWLIDFGAALGNARRGSPWAGDAWVDFDLRESAISLATLGAWPRPWETAPPPPSIPGVGPFDARTFRPLQWHTLSPWFPFLAVDDGDGFWGARRVLALDEARIRAAVEAAAYTDPRAAEYVVDTLLERRRKTVVEWLRRAGPLDRAEVRDDGDGPALCFVDLLRAQGWDDGDSRHAAHAWAPASSRPARRPLQAPAGQRERSPDDDPEVCFAPLPDDPYAIVDVRTTRAGAPAGRVAVHLARDPGGPPRVIGLRRGGPP